MTALELLEQSVQKDYEKENPYIKVIIKEELYNWKPSRSLIEDHIKNKNIKVVYNENEIPKLNITNRPDFLAMWWGLEAEFEDGFIYQERLDSDTTYSNGLVLSYFKHWAIKHYSGRYPLCSARQKIFLMRAIKKHKKVYDKQCEKDGTIEVCESDTVIDDKQEI